MRNDQVAGEGDEEGGENPDANVIFGTYIDKDSSDKPQGVKKMLKVSNFHLFYFCNLRIFIITSEI